MTGEEMGGIGAVLEVELQMARQLDGSTSAAVLVEGESDRRAVHALARRMGRNLGGEGVAVIAIAGATNVGRFLDLLRASHGRMPIVGLCDESESEAFSEAFEQAGHPNRVHVCSIDLEDELVRALGERRMIEVIRAQNEAKAFRSFQNQPDQRHKTVQQQMWRWLGNRKIRYASVLVNALDLEEAPEPLLDVLTATIRPGEFDRRRQ